jgi:hypothetical protein
MQHTEEDEGKILIIGNDHVIPFHDRDVVYNGARWLQSLIESNKKENFCLVRELGELILKGKKEKSIKV